MAFDTTIGGPSVDRINDGCTGRFEIADRDVLRPLQYCGSYFELLCSGQDISWLTRELVHMSGLHLEALVLRVGGFHSIPLGHALTMARVRGRIEPATWNALRAFTKVYNNAKHTMDHPKDTHLYSVPDGIVSYAVSRKLELRLYPMANLRTNFAIFQ